MSRDGSYEGAMQDSFGMDGAFNVGQCLAQTAALLKLGEEDYIKKGYDILATSSWYDA